MGLYRVVRFALRGGGAGAARREVFPVRPEITPPASHPALPPLAPLLLSFAVLLGVWQAAVMLLQPPLYLLPAPSDIAVRFAEVWQNGTFLRNLWPTVLESVGGFAVALVVATPFGYLLAHNRRLERWVAPYLAGVQAIPIIAVAPLIVVWWYGGELGRNILVAAVVVFFPIYSATLTGLRTIPRELREVAMVEGATLWQRVRYVELPLALPVLFSGMRTSLAYATTGAVVAEFLGQRYGLGALINTAKGLPDTPLIFVVLAALVVITLCFYGLLVTAERILLAWQDVR